MNNITFSDVDSFFGHLVYFLGFLLCVLIILAIVLNLVRILLMYLLVKNERRQVSFVFNYLDMHVKTDLISSFLKWQDLRSKLMSKASHNSFKAFKDKNIYCKDWFVHLCHDDPDKILVTLHEDCFTNLFLQDEDLDGRESLYNMATMILCMKGIKPEDKTQYYVRIKNRFINQELNISMIQFDLCRV